MRAFLVSGTEEGEGSLESGTIFLKRREQARFSLKRQVKLILFPVLA